MGIPMVGKKHQREAGTPQAADEGEQTAEHFSGEVHDGLSIAAAELLAHVGLSYSANLPSAIEMFKALPDESGLGPITINQVSSGD